MTQVLIDYKNVSGIFTESNAEALIQELEMRNYTPEDISILLSENSGSSMIKVKNENKAPEGATIGGISGGLLGAIIGGLTLVGSVLAPGVGLLAVGPVVGVLAGTAAGASAGGLLGGLIGMGIPEHEAKFYEDALREKGSMMVGVRVLKENSAEIKALFERYSVKGLTVSG
ncbi:MAG: hypothetical protein VKJ06_02145 [Vampirovibrionales bacterium]|nr:hypothetical protein [Vampirovibrionales bacterium]